MNAPKITDEDAAALLAGGVPGARADLAALAGKVGAMRTASRAVLARPSDALLALLRSDTGAEPVDVVRDADDRVTADARPRRKVAKMFGWFTGLGIGVKLLLAGGVAAAAAGGAAAIAVTSVPPAPLVVSTSTPTGTPSAGPTGTPTGSPAAIPTGVPTFIPCDGPFGQQVSKAAKDKPGTGSQFGAGVSAAAKANGSCAGSDDPTEKESDAPETQSPEPGAPETHAPKSGTPSTGGSEDRNGSSEHEQPGH